MARMYTAAISGARRVMTRDKVTDAKDVSQGHTQGGSMPPIGGWNTGVYMITNVTDGKVYVGSTGASLISRIKGHLKELRGNRHNNRYLQNAWNKHGPKCFRFTILERCKPELCVSREQYWLDLKRSYIRDIGYNLRPIAASNRGIVWTEESRAKLSAAQIGSKKDDVTKSRMSESQTSRWANPEERAAQSKRMKGNLPTNGIETRLKKSASVSKMWDDPQKKEVRIQALKKAWADPIRKAERVRKNNARRANRVKA